MRVVVGIGVFPDAVADRNRGRNHRNRFEPCVDGWVVFARTEEGERRHACAGRVGIVGVVSCRVRLGELPIGRNDSHARQRIVARQRRRIKLHIILP